LPTNSLAIRHRISLPFHLRLFITGVFVLCSGNLKAQAQDSVRIPADSVVHTHSPRKAVMYSLICPGLGQVYNRKYWKIPFIYGAGGAFLYYINFNQTKYKKFRDALYDEKTTQGSVLIDGYTYEYESLELGRDYFRRYRDLSIAGLAAIYLLSAIDAMVDAHFFYYDISDDLSMRIQPSVENAGSFASLGVSINFGF
jgi:hypothetical protein